MLHKDMLKTEIEEILEDKGEFIQIDYLDRYLKDSPSIDMKKFAYLKLARIYLNRSMFENAALMFKNAAINSHTFSEQQDLYTKEAKCYIRAQRFDEVQNAMKKAFAEANKEERRKVYDEIVDYFKKVGLDYLSQGLPGKAMNVFERLIRMKLTLEDKNFAKEKLLDIYQRLGKRKEYDFLNSVSYEK